MSVLGTKASIRRQKIVFDAFATVLALVLLALMYMPIYLMFTLSMKDQYEIIANFWAPPPLLRWGGLIWSWQRMAPGIGNTLVVIGASCLVLLLACVPAGYAFARMQFPCKEGLYLGVIALLMIPSVLTLTPSYTLIKDLGLYDSWLALILPWAAAGQAWGVMLVRNHMESLPQEMFDAARIDGCNELSCLWRLALPLSKSIMATVMVLKMVDYYNDYIWPMIVIEKMEKQVITVFVRYYSNNVGGYLIATVPLAILFLCTSSLYIEGLTAGAVKQ